MVRLARHRFATVPSSQGFRMSAPILDATSFWGLLTARHESSPDHPLLIDDAGRSLTVAEFVTEVEQVAAGFHALGIGEGTPVTWVLPTRMETIISSFALSRLGDPEPDHPHLSSP